MHCTISKDDIYIKDTCIFYGSFLSSGNKHLALFHLKLVYSDNFLVQKVKYLKEVAPITNSQEVIAWANSDVFW